MRFEPPAPDFGVPTIAGGSEFTGGGGGGGGRTVNDTDVVPVPPAFVALTTTVCAPSARPV